MTDLCLFPIPNCVTFPGTVFPLHVFEPRYRQMIDHCLAERMPVAICHTKAVLHNAPEADTLEQALSSNQATYRPYEVVSAGQCELLQRTEDGRMYLRVYIDQRYRIEQVKQWLPYQVYSAYVLADEAINDAEHAQNLLLKDKIIHRLAALAHDVDSVQRLLKSADWQQKTPQQFSFEVFGLVRFDADILQSILEMTRASDRLQFTLDLLNDV